MSVGFSFYKYLLSCFKSDLIDNRQMSRFWWMRGDFWEIIDWKFVDDTFVGLKNGCQKLQKKIFHEINQYPPNPRISFIEFHFENKIFHEISLIVQTKSINLKETLWAQMRIVKTAKKYCIFNLNLSWLGVQFCSELVKSPWGSQT